MSIGRIVGRSRASWEKPDGPTFMPYPKILQIDVMELSDREAADTL